MKLLSREDKTHSIRKKKVKQLVVSNKTFLKMVIHKGLSHKCQQWPAKQHKDDVDQVQSVGNQVQSVIHAGI